MRGLILLTLATLAAINAEDIDVPNMTHPGI